MPPLEFFDMYHCRYCIRRAPLTAWGDMVWLGDYCSLVVLFTVEYVAWRAARSY